MTFARSLALATLAGFAGTASATWSILIVNTRTGEIAVGSATCLTGFDLEANTPVLVPMVGAAAAQSFVDSNGQNRTYIRDSLLRGSTLNATLAGLASRDSGHQTRQYGMIKVNGEALTFTGTQAGPWAGGATGQIGEIAYAVQGNVLTGPPVVAAAVDAIVSTPGDLAAKLMASMEAARAMGGDGRCSCGPQADACGSPPASFTKSAHIGYMLIARAGDTQNCRAAYPTSGGVQQILIGDFNGDGLPEVFNTNSGSPAGLTLLPNLTTSGGPARLGSFSVLSAGGVTRGIVRGDFNRDGFADVVVSNINSGRLLPMLADGHGSFVQGSPIAAGTQPGTVVTGDLDNDGVLDLAVANTGADRITVFRGLGDGAFGPGVSVALPGRSDALATGDLDGNGMDDIVVVSGSARKITAFLNTGVLVFNPVALAIPSFSPACVAVKDLDGNGTADVVVGGGGALLLLVGSPGAYTASTIAAPANITDVAFMNADHDLVPDLAAITSSSSIRVYRGRGDGTFAEPVVVMPGFAASKFATGDLDDDGDDDIVYPTGGSTLVVASNLSRGPGDISFGEAGCASGPSYMDFNVANQTAGNADPVFQLRDLYDAWRAGLARVPDAVRSEAAFESSVPGHRGSRAMLVVRPLDLDGRPASRDWSWYARTPVGAVALAPIGDGYLGAAIIPEPGCGPQLIEVYAELADHRVSLMPSVTLLRTDPADFNGDGWIDGFDYDAYVGAFEAGDPGADFTPGADEPSVDHDDYEAYLAYFERGC